MKPLKKLARYRLMTDDIKTVDNTTDRITDMPKIHSPFKRHENSEGEYVVYDEINEGYKWVFEEAEKVKAVEKLHGTNVSVTVENGSITSVFNRSNRIKPYTKANQYITKAVLNSVKRGYLELTDGQHFGEVIGPKLHNNPHQVDKHYWIPFQKYAQKHLEYNSYGEYDTDFDSISHWFKEELFSLFHARWHNTGLEEAKVANGAFCEGIMFTHPDGRMAKLRRDMFEWYDGERH